MKKSKNINLEENNFTNSSPFIFKRTSLLFSLQSSPKKSQQKDLFEFSKAYIKKLGELEDELNYLRIQVEF